MFFLGGEFLFEGWVVVWKNMFYVHPENWGKFLKGLVKPPTRRCWTIFVEFLCFCFLKLSYGTYVFLLRTAETVANIAWENPWKSKHRFRNIYLWWFKHMICSTSWWSTCKWRRIFILDCKIKQTRHPDISIGRLMCDSLLPLLADCLGRIVTETCELLLSSWWFQRVFMFTPTWGNDPIWIIFFRWVETTN